VWVDGKVLRVAAWRGDETAVTLAVGSALGRDLKMAALKVGNWGERRDDVWVASMAARMAQTKDCSLA